MSEQSDDLEVVRMFERVGEAPCEPLLWLNVRFLIYKLDKREVKIWSKHEEAHEILTVNGVEPNTLMQMCRIIQSVNGGRKFKVHKYNEESRQVVLVHEDLAEKHLQAMLRSQGTGELISSDTETVL